VKCRFVLTPEAAADLREILLDKAEVSRAKTFPIGRDYGHGSPPLSKTSGCARMPLRPTPSALRADLALVPQFLD